MPFRWTRKKKAVGFLILLFAFGVWWWMGIIGTFPFDIFRGLTTENVLQEETDTEEFTTEISKVLFVIDGDTLILSDGRKVRFIGVDTPELWQPYYTEAKNRMTELVLGKEIELLRDVSEVDKHGRLLRYVYVGNEFVNLTIVEEGYARALTIPPDVTHAELFVSAEQRARTGKLGLWGALD